MSDTYFALEGIQLDENDIPIMNEHGGYQVLAPERLAGKIIDQAKVWREWVQQTGLERRWMQNLALYNGADPKSFSGTFNEDSFRIVGPNGEFLLTVFNDMRNIMQHVLVMTTGTQPAMTASAKNDDTASLISSQTFDGVFEYYLKTYANGRLKKQADQAVESAIGAGGDCGWMLVEWDTTLGEPVAPDPTTGSMTYTGDVYAKARTSWDVAYDPGIEDEDEASWYAVRDQIDKYELASRFPEHKTAILSAQPNQSAIGDWRRGFGRPIKSNMVDVWKFYHKKTCNVPQGMRALLLDDKTLLLCEPLPYDQLPVFRVSAQDSIGGITGYAPANSMAPVQQSQNIMASAINTNYAQFGVQNIAVKATDDFDPEIISGAMNVLKYNETAPIALQLAQQANGIVDWYGILRKVHETLGGINSVVRGDPESSLKSGKALGIIQAVAVQFQSALAASYAKFLENIANHLLQIFRKFAKSTRIVQIVGENEVRQSVEWNADTFGPIDRVVAEIIDPAMRTLGFKSDLANFMVQNGLITTPQEYLMVITTGQLKPLVRGSLSALNNIHSENDDLTKNADAMQQEMQQLGMQGVPQQPAPQPPTQPPAGSHPVAIQQWHLAAQQWQAQQQQWQQWQQLLAKYSPPVMLTDNDDLHVQEHTILTDSPGTRRNALVTQLALYHLNAHDQNKITKAAKVLLDQALVQAKAQQMMLANGIQPAPPPQALPPGHVPPNAKPANQAPHHAAKQQPNQQPAAQ